MFRKASDINFQPKRRYKIVASRQLEIPFYKGIGRQRGRGLGAVAQDIGRTSIPFLRKYIVPAAKRVGADLLEYAAPEIAEVVTGRKKFKTAAKSAGKSTLKNKQSRVAAKGLQAELLEQKLQNKPVGPEETYLETFLINQFGQFSAPTFCGSFCKPWREIPSSWRCLVFSRLRNLSYYLTRLKLHRVLISNGSDFLCWGRRKWPWN